MKTLKRVIIYLAIAALFYLLQAHANKTFDIQKFTDISKTFILFVFFVISIIGVVYEVSEIIEKGNDDKLCKKK